MAININEMISMLEVIRDSHDAGADVVMFQNDNEKYPTIYDLVRVVPTYKGWVIKGFPIG